MKRSDSFRSFLRILTLKTRWEAERWNFTKKNTKSEFSHFGTPLWEERKMIFFLFFSFSVIQRGLKAWIMTAALGFLTSESTKRSIRFRPLSISLPQRGSSMRKFLAIKINCTLNTYFPRPRLKRRTPGLAPERGTREGVSRNSRFCHFLKVVGSNPGWSKNEKVIIF